MALGRIGNRPSGASRALITIPFQPIPFLDGITQHWFQIPTAKASGHLQWTVSSARNARTLPVALEVTSVTMEAGAKKSLGSESQKIWVQIPALSLLVGQSLAITSLSFSFFNCKIISKDYKFHYARNHVCFIHHRVPYTQANA